MNQTDPTSPANSSPEVPKLSLRARPERIDLSHFPSLSRSPEPPQFSGVEILTIPERDSRHWHLPEVPAEEEKSLSEDQTTSDSPAPRVTLAGRTADPEPIRSIGHISAEPTPGVKTDDSSQQEVASAAQEIQHRIKDLVSRQDSVQKKSNPIPKRKRFAVNFDWKEGVKILATGMAIFVITIVGMNFAAYSQILNSFLNPHQIEGLKKSLDDLTGPSAKLARQKLLPVAGVERQLSISIPTLFSVMPPDNRLIIPKLGKNIPLIDGVGMDALLAENWKQLEESIQKGLQSGVVLYPGTATPGSVGNAFITGHSSYYPWDPGRYKNVFALLHKLDVGDEYSIIWKGNEYKYKIVERKIVNPENVSVLEQPADRELSTLMTCDPVGTTIHRLILVGEREKQE